MKCEDVCAALTLGNYSASTGLLGSGRGCSPEVGAAQVRGEHQSRGSFLLHSPVCFHTEEVCAR